MGISKSQIQRFRQRVYQAYGLYGRHSLPWRTTNNPYYILVSEFMLQQTQVKRVMQKYPEFIKTFPTLQALARAPLRKVLGVWSGMGYNRRALNLHKTAKLIQKEHKSRVPSEVILLEALPGIGHATACEIAAFAYSRANPFIETNIRSVYIYTFFRTRRVVHDKDILPLVALTMDTRNPRAWYYALMDYGVFLKQHYDNPSRKSRHYRKQDRFEGSSRQVRGRILRILTKGEATASEIRKVARTQDSEQIVTAMIKEGLIERHGRRYRIPR
jgi:A/G-specific adenine glycosylase